MPTRNKLTYVDSSKYGSFEDKDVVEGTFSIALVFQTLEKKKMQF